MNTPQVTRWSASTTPTESTLRQLCADEGLDPYVWSNGLHESYSVHTHSYDKVIYVVLGSITFSLPELVPEKLNAYTKNKKINVEKSRQMPVAE